VGQSSIGFQPEGILKNTALCRESSYYRRDAYATLFSVTATGDRSGDQAKAGGPE